LAIEVVSADTEICMAFIILDTETTGLSLTEDAIVEIAMVRLLQDGTIEKQNFNSLVNPNRPIPPVASAIHHLTDRHVANAPALTDISSEIRRYVGEDIIVAHNAPFDQAFCQPLGLGNAWLCNLRLSRHLWPRAPTHANQVLRYWLNIDVDTQGMPPHRALADALVTAHVFKCALQTFLEGNPGATNTDLLAFASRPIAVEVMPFGKHTGRPLGEIPTDYVKWALDNVTDMDPDLRWSLKTTHKMN